MNQNGRTTTNAAIAKACDQVGEVMAMEVQAPSTPKPMQGLADWLRAMAETQAADTEQEACMRQWAREVDAPYGVAPSHGPSDDELDALAMQCCGDLRADRLCMTRDQRINFARKVLAAHGVTVAEAPSGGVVWTPEDEARLDAAIAKRAAARGVAGTDGGRQ